MNPNAMKSKMIVALVPAVLLVPTIVGAQSATASAQSQAQVQTQTASQAQSQTRSPQARIDAAMSAAAEAKVPAELVKSKIAEGEAKRVPPDRIATAVEARVTSLVRASQTMKRSNIEMQSSGELAVTADALDAGVSEAALVRVTREAAPERRTVAIAVLADLVRLGSGSDQAFARVNGALTSSAALANLQAEVASQLRLGGLSSTLDAAGVIRTP
ncbi:MAG TPA: hypothetical protein VM076_10895 [Gemmatimonadaceae bacterium]|nr:hypothetical protein [Gemmatimonadaceae bacterium]